LPDFSNAALKQHPSRGRGTGVLFFRPAFDAVCLSCSDIVLGAELESGRLPRTYLAKPRFRLRLRFAALGCGLIEKLRPSSRQLGEVAFDFGGDPVGLLHDADLSVWKGSQRLWSFGSSRCVRYGMTTSGWDCDANVTINFWHIWDAGKNLASAHASEI